MLLLASLIATGCGGPEEVAQPVEFNHRVHVEKQITCTFCHAGAERNSQATLPSVTLCMSCHSVVKTDSPEVVKAKSYLDRGLEIPWVRLYKMEREAAVFFDHRRHAAAEVRCEQCHGDVAGRDVLRREVELTMGFCVQCHVDHKEKFLMADLAADCATCHR